MTGRTRNAFVAQQVGSRRRRAVAAIVVCLGVILGVTSPAFAIPAQFTPSVATGLIGANKDVGALRECPAGKAVVGVRVQDRQNVAPSSAWGILVQLDLLCGTIDTDSVGNVVVTPDTSWTSYNPYDQGTGRVTQGLCPANTVATRMGGFVFYGTTSNNVRLYWASTISLACRPLVLDAGGALRVNMAVTPSTVSAGVNENLNDNRFHGWFCGTTDTQVLVGYRPQYGGEGLDGVTPSCATIGRDFDDAPSSFGAASHEMNTATYLGSAMTVEQASRPSPTAGLDGGDDGIAAFPRLVQGQTGTYEVDVTATNHSLLPAMLSGWVDWNGNGIFDGDELATAMVPPGTTAEAVRLTWSGVAERTADLAAGTVQLGSRFRIGVGSVDGPTGAGTPGEVEDYMVAMEPMNPVLWIVKSTDSTGDLPSLGDRIDYDFTIGNGGNVRIEDIVLSDPNVDRGSISCPATSLEPGARMVCTAHHTVTQEDLDAGNVRNQATVTGTDPAGKSVNATSNVVQVPPDSVVELTIEKRASPTTVTAAGQVIEYTFIVTNRGTVTMREAEVTDPKASGLTCVFTDFAPGDQETCTGTHTVTQAEIDAGGTIDNIATVAATPTGSDETVSVDSNEVRVAVDQRPSLEVVKRTNQGQVNEPGTTVAYGIEVRNTGNVTITDLVVTDPSADSVSCEATELAPGAVMQCLAQRTIGVDEFDAGGNVVNTASASGTAPGGSTLTQPSNEVSLPIVHRPGIEVVKTTTTQEMPAVGEEITYAYVVENTGNVTLTDITVSDDVLGPIACGIGPLPAGESRTCDVGTHTVTQADVDRGEIVNVATAEGTPPDGSEPVTDDSEPVRVPGSADPGIEIVKSADTETIAEVGQQVTYTFVVRNTGNVTLSDVTVTDPLLGDDLDCTPQDLAPRASMTCSGVYAVIQDDLDRGFLENVASVTASAPGGTRAVDDSEPVRLSVEERPKLSLDKSSVATDLPAAGGTIEYSYVVTNTGNVPLRDIAVTDDRIAAVTCPDTDLPAGASMTCTGTYEVIQADVDAGSVTNNATVTGSTPSGEAVPPARDTLSVPGDADPAIDVRKRADVDTVDAVGDVITYTITVRNIGNVTLSDPTVTDPLIPEVGCPEDVTLAPGDSIDCVGTYTVVQDDLDRGAISNIAGASATPPNSEPLEPRSSNRVDVQVDERPGITATKTAGEPDDANGDGILNAGDTITYTVLVRNVGNVTLHAVRVDDSKVPGMSCPPGELAVGEETACRGAYRITQADMDAGRVDNRASGTATTPGGGNVPPVDSDEVVVELVGAPYVEVVKSASVDELVAGETITYSFGVTNTGTVTLADVSVLEGEFTGAGELSAVECPAAAASLAPGDEVVCTATYTVTQADVDAGSIRNTATAAGTPPAGDRVVSEPSAVHVPNEANPGLSITKTVDKPRVTKAGEVLTYSFAVTNTGNVTLSEISVAEGDFSGAGELSTITCPIGAETLPPGESVLCTATYTVVAADLTGRGLTNTASATGVPPGVSDPVSATPSLVTVETVAPSGYLLSATGGQPPLVLVVATVLLMLAGAGVVVARRRIADR